MGSRARILSIDPAAASSLAALIERRTGAGADLAHVVVRHPPRLAVDVLSVKRVPAGAGVSYGHTHVTSTETTLALVSIGYGHGIPRKAGNRAAVTWAGAHGLHRLPIVGRVAMDVLVVDAGDHAIAAGDAVVVFGDPARGEIGVDEWAASIGEEAATLIACLDRVAVVPAR